jgi:hypothetical protein
MEGVI